MSGARRGNAAIVSQPAATVTESRTPILSPRPSRRLGKGRARSLGLALARKVAQPGSVVTPLMAAAATPKVRASSKFETLRSRGGAS